MIPTGFLGKLDVGMTQKKAPDHYIRHDDLEYGRAVCRGQDIALRLDLSLPKAARNPVPLIMWIHGGGFRNGHKDWAGHMTDSRWFTKAGYAFASIDYRLKAERSDLSDPVRQRMTALEKHCDPEFRKDLAGAAALAAMEDALTALTWLQDNRAGFNLSGWVALGGNSAGAITAFNTAYLTGFFGLSRPAIRGIVSISGGFAYPALYAPGLAPVHALHNPTDDRVDIALIRRIEALGGDAVELVTSDRQLHGRVRLAPDEPPREAYGRIFRFLDRLRDNDP